MIELILTMYLISEKLMILDQDIIPRGAFCRELRVTASFLETREVYDVAEKRWADNEDRLEGFYAFWENRDACITSDRAP